MSRTLYCGNCGKYGHSYRKCLSPILSIGIILFKEENNKLEYLLVQRKDTLGFVEFMRGKYNLENITYVSKLFEIMTITERENILNLDFDTLWNNLWMKKNNNQYQNEYDKSKSKFKLLKNGVYYKKSLINIKNIINTINTKWKEPEWGFPKGRRNLKENNLDCAIREFEEETGINKNEYIILFQIDPIEETFSGTNNIRYKHIYYIAKLISHSRELKIDKNNFNQVTEISNIKWFNFIDSLKSIRNYNIEKKNALEKLHNLLIK